MPLNRIVALAGLVVGIGALVLQFALTIPARVAAGHDLLSALVFFFTFFTILTNLMLVLIYASEVTALRWLGWWRAPATRGMMVACMALVTGFYHLLLAGLWNPQGWFQVADVTLHYGTPVLYIAWWLAFQPKGTLRVGHIGWMLVPPAGWLAWTMLRGAIVSEYPYPILEAHVLGYGQVALNIGLVLVVLVAMFAAVIGLDRLLARVPAAAAR